MKKRILRAIRPVRRKKYIENGLNAWMVVMAVGSAVALAMSVAAHFVVFPFVMRWMLIVLGTSCGIGLLIGLVRYPRTWEVLKLSDSYGLKERLMTSWQLVEDKSEEAELQRKETLSFIDGRRLGRSYRWNLKYRYMIGSVLAVLLAFGLFFIQSPAKREAEEREAFKNELLEEKEELLAKKDELLEEYEIPEEKKQELEETLKPLLEKLEKAKTEEEALKQLSIAKDEIQKLGLDEEIENLENLQEVLKKMSSLQKERLEGNQDIGDDELKALMESLQDLAKALEDDELKNRIMEQLDRLAEDLENAGREGSTEGDMENLAQSIDDLAKLLDDLKNSDAGSQLAAQLQEMINQMAGDLAGDSSIAELAFQSQNGNTSGSTGTSNSSSSSSDSATESTGSTSGDASAPSTGEGSGEGGESSGEGSDGSGSGDGDGSGDGSGDGEGSGEGDGNGSGDGSGDGAGEGSGSGSGSGTGGQGSGTGGDGRGFGTTEEYLFDPTRIGGTSDPTFVKGNRLDGGDMDTNDVNDKPLETGELVNYQELYREYFDSAVESMDHLDVPVVMRDIILEYFSDIE